MSKCKTLDEIWRFYEADKLAIISFFRSDYKHFNKKAKRKEAEKMEADLDLKRQAVKEIKEMIHHVGIDEDWLPTPENINALPDPVRRLIHLLETNTDPAHIVRENILIKDTCRSLLLKLEEKRKVTEGWIQKMAEDTASDYPYVAFPNLITIFKKLLKEAGVKVVKK